LLPTKVALDNGLKLVEQKLSGKKLLFLAVSGSHVWGLERPDSDIDFRGVYQEPTINLLQLDKGSDTVEMSVDNYDLQLYEVEKFFRMLCNHNGNMVNLMFLPIVYVDNNNINWVELGTKFLTKKLRYYYRGYAESQRKRAMSCRGGKALIYTYREMFCGLYTMKYGNINHNFNQLWEEAKKNKWYNGTMLDKFYPNILQEITDEDWHRFYNEWEELCIQLDEIAKISPLPDTFDGRNMCSELLVNLRLLDLDEKNKEMSSLRNNYS